MISIEFLITSLIVVLIPGTGVIYTVSVGLTRGWTMSVAAALGCTLGIVPHLTASVLGLSAIMHMSAVAFQCMKYIGGLYLLYLAWSMWKETGGINFNGEGGSKGVIKIATRGFLINILNPKLSIFFLAFLPLFVKTEAVISPIAQLLLFSAIFMTLTFVVFVFYGACAHVVRKYIAGSPKILIRIQRSFAVVLAFLGLKLMAVER